MNNTYIKLLIGAVLLFTWVALVVCKVPDAGDIINTIKIALSGLGVYHLSERQLPMAPMTKEGGFARLPLLFCMSILAALLAGCAAWQQAVQTYGTVAVTNAKAANDTLIEAQKVTLCGLPFSAIERHPEIVPVIRALCVASKDANTSKLLDAIEQKPAR